MIKPTMERQGPLSRLDRESVEVFAARKMQISNVTHRCAEFATYR
jgi:hypothetical protein